MGVYLLARAVSEMLTGMVRLGHDKCSCLGFPFGTILFALLEEGWVVLYNSESYETQNFMEGEGSLSFHASSKNFKDY